MPRKQGGIGRTGNKHKKVALHDIHRQPKRKRDDADGAGCSRAIEALEHATASAEAAAAPAAASAEALDLADTQVALAGCAEEQASSSGGSSADGRRSNGDDEEEGG